MKARRIISVVVAALVGIVIGMGVFGVSYAHLPSYFGEDPATCANCHAMQDHYDAWLRGPHARAATCNDCHVPHDNVIRQYAVKAEDGVLHAYKFTVGDYPTNIVIRDKNRDIANAACLSCHDLMTFPMRYTVEQTGEDIQCTRCHSNIGHQK
ncbi:MAG: cytochrome c nitrite reductase small subunit [Propionibacteriaceae bacterium]|nr:cytochrome c nitrite reductase small subunit [Propionibacteriaceae bacterium]